MEAPYLLVALPQLQDPVFMKTVVMITSHTEEGASGIILNKALVDEEEGEQALMRAEIRDLAGNMVFQFDEDLFEGGPLNDESIFLIHEYEELGDTTTEVGEGLFISSDPTQFQKVLEKADPENKRYRFFLGSAGWQKGQLDSELRTGSWLPVPFQKKLVFEPVSDLKSSWQESIWIEALKAGGCDPFTLMAQGPTDVGVN